VLRILLCVLVGGLGCTKDEPSRREPQQRPQLAAPEPARPAPKSPFGGARLIVDATSVKLDGVSLGTGPAANHLTWLLKTVVVHPPPAAPTPMVVTAECNTRCCTGD
jgi:hypothetical protein